METGSTYPCTLNCKRRWSALCPRGLSALTLHLFVVTMGTCSTHHCRNSSPNYMDTFFSSLRTTPESENSKLFFFFSPSLLFFIYFASWVGRKLRFRLCPVKSKLKVKKLPMRASLFSIKTLFWTTGNIFSLSFSHWIKKTKTKGAYGLNFSSSPFSSRQV